MARTLAFAVLSEDPRNATALAVLSAVGLVTREPMAARVVAGQSFRAATDHTEKFTAARLAARASVELAQPEIAKYWLRRAVQVAPTPEAKAATIRDFLVIRRQSPLRLDFGLSVKPSDNVNQGAEDSLLVIDGIPTLFYFNASTLALSGVEAKVNFGVRYRVFGTVDAPTEIGLRFNHRAVTLSEAARATAPTARGSDFASSTLEALILHRMVTSETQNLGFGLSLGKTWLAGQPYSDRVRADISMMTTHGERSLSRFGFVLERQWLDGNQSVATAFNLDAGIQHRLGSGDVVALRLEIGITKSDDANQELEKKGVSLRYSFGKPIGGARLSAVLDITTRDFPVFFNGVFNDSGREDVSVSANLDVALPEVGVFGFEPVLTLEASRTESNVSRYTGTSLGVGLRIQSSF
jgi:hypothetical protein